MLGGGGGATIAMALLWLPSTSTAQYVVQGNVYNYSRHTLRRMFIVFPFDFQLKGARERLGQPCDMCKNYEAQLQEVSSGSAPVFSVCRGKRG